MWLASVAASETFQIPEDADTGTIVGHVSGKDPDAGQQVRYKIERENCFEITSGKDKRYQTLPPVYPGTAKTFTATANVRAKGHVHILLSRATIGIEVVFRGINGVTELRYCRKFSKVAVLVGQNLQ